MPQASLPYHDPQPLSPIIVTYSPPVNVNDRKLFQVLAQLKILLEDQVLIEEEVARFGATDQAIIKAIAKTLNIPIAKTVAKPTATTSFVSPTGPAQVQPATFSAPLSLPKLGIAVQIHVEGGTGFTHEGKTSGLPRVNWSSDPKGLERCMNAWNKVEPLYRAQGIKFSFLAGVNFWTALKKYGYTSFVQDMQSKGHMVGLHDHGGVTVYREAKAALEKLGWTAPSRLFISGVRLSELNGFSYWSENQIYTGFSGLLDTQSNNLHAQGNDTASYGYMGLTAANIAMGVSRIKINWQEDLLEVLDKPEYFDQQHIDFALYTGSGSLSKLQQMYRDIRQYGGVLGYPWDVENKPQVLNFAMHHVACDFEGTGLTGDTTTSHAFGISPLDTPEKVLEVLVESKKVAGTQFMTYQEMFDACFKNKLSFITHTTKDFHEEGPNHWEAFGGTQ